MRVTEAKFARRYNVAQYEHEDYSLTAVVEDDDKAVEVLASLKADVAAAYGGKAEASPTPTIADPSATPAKEKKEKKAAKAKKEPEPEEAEEEAEEENEDEQPEDPAEEEEAEEEAEEEEAEEEETDPPPAKTGKKFKKKPQVYSRANEQHKEIFSKTLLSVAPDWKKTAESKAKAKNASQKMEGEEFLDEAGEVLDSFKEGVKKLMSGKKK